MKKRLIAAAALILITVALITGIKAGEERTSFADARKEPAQQEKRADKAEETDMNETDSSKEEDSIQREKQTEAAAGKNSESGKSRMKNASSGEKAGSSALSVKAEKSTKASDETHTHSWSATYGQRQVEKRRQVAWTKCYACGEDMTGDPHHIDRHLLDHEPNVHYGTEYRIEVYYETESYVSGYKCSCGATK